MKNIIDDGTILAGISGIVLGVLLLLIINKTGSPVPTPVGPVVNTPIIIENPVVILKPEIEQEDGFHDSSHNWN